MPSFEVSVKSVVDNKVEMFVGNIVLCFYFQGGKMKSTRYKPEARVCNQFELWVPDGLFKKACRQAAAILRSRQKK
ncbi:hypothetical protein A2999_00190 [Candidatus Wolfebacteria bacterium RIFCSPLOWO2_01_FULL_38_11]|uniref:Uncharacterized protein n=1 Tax=Candidatus Wolfebacteria bacterium RIFCSPLOWO2_01_FULL_38_11 TaxID=1802556 RepID=A0A1F8DPL0_9BACT|nr:MAG: hypothetical protein A2999_00190 [Candidatus Wolfebacteria bacterium RIFCSPLOWO2_01_FULL_38_11]